MKLCLLLCEDFEGILAPGSAPYARLFVDLFNAAATAPIEWEIVDARADALPAPDPAVKYIITGSRASAYDSTPWVLRLGDFIRKAYDRRAKLIGICFGHQLIAEALGGKVSRAEVGWGSSIRRSPILDEALKRRWERDSFLLEYNHHDQVLRIPEGTTRFCGSVFCPNEGFYETGRVLTFQGHPEFTRDYAAQLFSFFESEIDAAERALHEAHRNDATDAPEVAGWILEF